MARARQHLIVTAVHRWLVRLTIRNVDEDRLSPAAAKYLASLLDYLGFRITAVSGPPTVELTVLAERPSAAFDYAAGRVQEALRTIGLDRARCELVGITVEVPPG